MSVSLRKTPVVHIHQGGTTNTYCGAPLREATNVSWEQVAEATCAACAAFFAPKPCCPGAARGRCKVGCAVGVGR